MRRWKKAADVETISKMLQDGLEQLFQSAQYRQFLAMMSRFPNYSYRNILLLLSQCPHATRTRTARGWPSEGRLVKSGEKGLRIIAPRTREMEKKNDEATKKKKEKFRCIRVFDISQTRPLAGPDDVVPVPPVQPAPFPFKTEELTGQVPDFDLLMAVLRDISPFPILLKEMKKKTSAKGRTNYTRRVILVRAGMSQLHTVKTAIHEIAHALLHGSVSDKQQEEIEAESIAFMVCHHLGLDTSEYSFSYIAGYSMGREKKELTAFLDTIQKTACYLIDSIDGELEAGGSATTTVTCSCW